jgi:hypothetical protein
MTLDMVKLRELAAEFCFFPASVEPEDVERTCAELAEHDRWRERAKASSLFADQLEHGYAHLRNRGRSASPTGGTRGRTGPSTIAVRSDLL